MIDVGGGYLDIPAVKTAGFKMIDAFLTYLKTYGVCTALKVPRTFGRFGCKRQYSPYDSFLYCLLSENCDSVVGCLILERFVIFLRLLLISGATFYAMRGHFKTMRGISKHQSCRKMRQL